MIPNHVWIFKHFFKLQDALYKKHCHRSLEDRIEIVIRILEKHRDYQSRAPNSLAFLTGVAGIRFAISEIANIHNFFFSTKDIERPQDIKLLVARLMQQGQAICVSSTNPNDLLRPAIFLLKMIVRQFGFPCLKFVSKEYEWVIPVSLRTKENKVRWCSQVYITSITPSHYMPPPACSTS